MATSQLKQAIKDIKARILTNSQFIYCAVFNDQIKQEESGKTFVFPKPAVLVEISSPSNGLQTLGSYGVTVHDFIFRFSIVHEQLNAEYDGTAGSGMDENLDVFDLRDTLKTLLTGFQPTNCSNLQYDSESQDYAHDNIYVYGISFRCSYVDTKGSPYDVDSNVWVDGQIDILNLNTFVGWQSGKSYQENKQAVTYGGLIYLCANDNSDTVFTVANWLEVDAWQGNTSYVATNYVAYQNNIYQCSVDNSDATFDFDKWTKII